MIDTEAVAAPVRRWKHLEAYTRADMDIIPVRHRQHMRCVRPKLVNSGLHGQIIAAGDILSRPNLRAIAVSSSSYTPADIANVRAAARVLGSTPACHPRRSQACWSAACASRDCAAPMWR